MQQHIFRTQVVKVYMSTMYTRCYYRLLEITNDYYKLLEITEDL